MIEAHRDGMWKRKINLKLYSRTLSLLQIAPSLSGTFGFNCGIRDAREQILYKRARHKTE